MEKKKEVYIAPRALIRSQGMLRAHTTALRSIPKLSVGNTPGQRQDRKTRRARAASPHRTRVPALRRQ